MERDEFVEVVVFGGDDATVVRTSRAYYKIKQPRQMVKFAQKLSKFDPSDVDGPYPTSMEAREAYMGRPANSGLRAPEGRNPEYPHLARCATDVLRQVQQHIDVVYGAQPVLSSSREIELAVLRVISVLHAAWGSLREEIDSELPPETRELTVAAIYFSGELIIRNGGLWIDEIDPEMTGKRRFYLSPEVGPIVEMLLAQAELIFRLGELEETASRTM